MLGSGFYPQRLVLNTIMQWMTLTSLHLQRKDKVKTLSDSFSVKASQDRSIDPALLLQRILVISNAGDFSLEEVLDCKLSPFPQALFEASYIMRKPEKTQLAKAIDEYASSSSPMRCQRPRTRS